MAALCTVVAPSCTFTVLFPRCASAAMPATATTSTSAPTTTTTNLRIRPSTDDRTGGSTLLTGPDATSQDSVVWDPTRVRSTAEEAGAGTGTGVDAGGATPNPGPSTGPSGGPVRP